MSGTAYSIMFHYCSVSVESESLEVRIISLASIQKHLTLAEIIKLLDFYQKENISALTLANKFGIGRTQTTGSISNKVVLILL